MYLHSWCSGSSNPAETSSIVGKRISAATCGEFIAEYKDIGDDTSGDLPPLLDPSETSVDLICNANEPFFDGELASLACKLDSGVSVGWLKESVSV
jgi:hypothetical protein